MCSKGIRGGTLDTVGSVPHTPRGLIEFAYEVTVANLDKGDYEKIAEVALQQP